ncbi:MAG: PorT family protein, partial [Bacteroidales bacterium]|nr:PorT family protein [Bacteroidales bacterium]
MKKLILLAIIVCISGYTFGQVNFGIKAAVTMNKLTTALDDWGDAVKISFQAGAFLRVGKKFHVQPEGYITIKNGEFSVVDSENNISFNNTIKLTTLDIPLLIGYKLLKPKKLNIRVQAGPVASVVLNKKYEISFDGLSPEDEITLEDAFNKTNWGLQLGGGIDILFLTVDVRYEFG